MNLMNSLFAWSEDLEVEATIRGLFFGLFELLAGEVPVSEESLGISGGEEEAAGSVTFG